MRAYVTEFIGTFFLVLTIGLAVSSGSPMAPLAIGASLMVMVYMGGHISGAHYNPAVSLAVMLRGKLPPREFPLYCIAQICGAVVAASATLVITHKTPYPTPSPDVSWLGALLVEVFYTFALALVVLNAATAEKTVGNSYYGLAIGFTVVVAAFAGGSISGGAFNPAVGIGTTLLAVLKGGTGKYLWLYLVGPLAGGALAGAVFRYQNEAPLPAVDTSAPAGPKEALGN